jgi:taspase (threonine aspartase 1)
MQPVIAITGATGKQGGSVVNALLAQSKFKVRAISRNPGSDNAKALASRGVEVFKGDLNDKASLVQAFNGAYGAFLVTDFAGGAKGNPETEITHGKNGVDAAMEAGVKHLVWSSLEDPRKLEGVADKLKEVAPGRLVPHFESKAEVTEYAKASGVPTTVLHTSVFYDNFGPVLPFIPQGGEGTSKSYAFFLNAGAQKAHAACDSADIGKTAAVALADSDKYIGQTIPVVGQLLSFKDAADVISSVTGKNLKYIDIPDEKMAAAGFPGAEDLANMWQFYKEFDYFNDARPVTSTIVKGKTFEEWAEDHKKELTASFK